MYISRDHLVQSDWNHEEGAQKGKDHTGDSMLDVKALVELGRA